MLDLGTLLQTAGNLLKQGPFRVRQAVYSDGVSSVTLNMWRGNMSGGRVGSEGSDYGPEEWIDDAFCCFAAELSFDGGTTLIAPERGHTITLPRGDVFTVAAPGEDKPCRYSDTAATILRIHTRRGT